MQTTFRGSLGTLVGMAATFVVLAACSSGSAQKIPSAAEPSVAPSPTARPAGRIVSLPAESAPEGVVVDPITHLVVVALRTPDRIALIDERTLTVTYRPTDGRARHLTLAKPGGPVLLPGEDTNQLLQISLPSGRTTSYTILLRNPHNAAVIGDHYWVDDELAPAISVLSTDGRVLATLRGPVQPGGVAAAAGRVGVTDVRGARLYFYDQTTYRAQGSIRLGAGPTHDAYVGDRYVLVTDTRGGALVLVDMSAKKIAYRSPLPGAPYGLAVDSSSGQAWVTLTALNQLVHVTVADGKIRVLDRTPTVQQPNTVGVDTDSRCVYVAGVTPAQLEVICPAHSGGS